MAVSALCFPNLESAACVFRTSHAPPHAAPTACFEAARVSAAPTPLNQLASVTCPTASQLVVDPYDKSAIGDVEKV